MCSTIPWPGQHGEGFAGWEGPSRFRNMWRVGVDPSLQMIRAHCHLLLLHIAASNIHIVYHRLYCPKWNDSWLLGSWAWSSRPPQEILVSIANLANMQQKHEGHVRNFLVGGVYLEWTHRGEGNHTNYYNSIVITLQCHVNFGLFNLQLTSQNNQNIQLQFTVFAVVDFTDFSMFSVHCPLPTAAHGHATVPRPLDRVWNPWCIHQNHC